MSTPRIAAVATAVPPHRFTQTDILARAGYADDRRRGFFAASDIEGRHLWMDPARFTPDENVDQLNARFCEGALALSLSAATAAVPPSSVTARSFAPNIWERWASSIRAVARASSCPRKSAGSAP